MHARIVIGCLVPSAIAAFATGSPAEAQPSPSSPEATPAPKPTVTSDLVGKPTSQREASVPRALGDSDSPVTDADSVLLEVRSTDGQQSLRVGLLLSASGEFGFASPQKDDNGFVLTDGRLALLGSLHEAWSYMLQVDFARGADALLDVRGTYRPFAALRIQFGRFKIPFSGEFMIPAADIDLINRAQVVSALAPGRSVGIEIGGNVQKRLFFYRGGIYNGNADFANDGNNYLVVGRLGSDIALYADGTLLLAANVAYSKDSNVPLPLFPAAPFNGTRLLAGGDMRLTLNIVDISAELIHGRFEPAGGTTATMWGYHATVGVRVMSFLAFLVRWDSFTRDDLSTKSEQVISSISFAVPKVPPMQFQADVVVPVRDADQTQLLVNATIAY